MLYKRKISKYLRQLYFLLCSSTPQGWCLSDGSFSHISFKTKPQMLHRMKALMGCSGGGGMRKRFSVALKTAAGHYRRTPNNFKHTEPTNQRIACSYHVIPNRLCATQYCAKVLGRLQKVVRW